MFNFLGIPDAILSPLQLQDISGDAINNDTFSTTAYTTMRTDGMRMTRMVATIMRQRRGKVVRWCPWLIVLPFWDETWIKIDLHQYRLLLSRYPPRPSCLCLHCKILGLVWEENTIWARFDYIAVVNLLCHTPQNETVNILVSCSIWRLLLWHWQQHGITQTNCTHYLCTGGMQFVMGIGKRRLTKIHEASKYTAIFAFLHNHGMISHSTITEDYPPTASLKYHFEYLLTLVKVEPLKLWQHWLMVYRAMPMVKILSTWCTSQNIHGISILL